MPGAVNGLPLRICVPGIASRQQGGGGALTPNAEGKKDAWQ